MTTYTQIFSNNKIGTRLHHTHEFAKDIINDNPSEQK